MTVHYAGNKACADVPRTEKTRWSSALDRVTCTCKKGD